MTPRTERTTAEDVTDDRLSTIFGEALRRIFTSYGVTLTRPEPATSGGPLTLQRIHLVTGHRVPLLLGWTNAAERRAQLHTLGHTLALSKLQLGTELVMPPLEYARFLETATRLLEDEGMTVSIVAFVREGADSGLRLRANARRRSTMPYYLLDAMSAVGTFASRVAASAPALDEDRDDEPAVAARAASAATATAVRAPGWSKVLRWAPSAGVAAAADGKGDSSQ